MFIIVKSLMGETFVLEVDPHKDTVGDVYTKTAMKMDQEEASLRIIYYGKLLGDKTAPLAPLELHKACCLHVVVKTE